MTIDDILESLGNFSSFDKSLFEKHTTIKKFSKNEILLNTGDVCQCFYFILSGAFSQFQTIDLDEVIIDLHVENEWMFNQQSLTEQSPSNTTIKAFSNAEVLELSLKVYTI
jgi:CRP-like cAMP-binding protein